MGRVLHMHCRTPNGLQGLTVSRGAVACAVCFRRDTAKRAITPRRPQEQALRTHRFSQYEKYGVLFSSTARSVKGGIQIGEIGGHQPVSVIVVAQVDLR